MLRLISGAAVISALVILSCAGEGSSDSGSANVKHGKEVYRKYCVLCHGEDGKKEVNGAYDISVSQMTMDDRVELITHGRNLMTPFQGILNDQEIRDVAAYSMQLTKK